MTLHFRLNRAPFAFATTVSSFVIALLACATEDGRVLTVHAAEQQAALDLVTGTWATADGMLSVTLCPHEIDPTLRESSCMFDSSRNEDVECLRSNGCHDSSGCGTAGACVAFSLGTHVGVVVERSGETQNLVGHLDFGASATELFGSDITRYRVSTSEVNLTFSLGSMNVQTGRDYVYDLERVDASACN